MASDRQQRIESLYHAALAQPAGARAAFLAEACEGDDLLRGEVESLLAHAVADSFLEQPALTPPPRLTSGQTLGHYVIVAPLGKGGMGEVYRARDTRLPREVAIKVLPAHVASDPDRRKRLEREAHAVSALNHQHICTLHDVGHEDGLDFLVLELVEGGSLSDRLSKGPLPLAEAITIAVEIAEGLSAAHRRGIVHRDLKPGNVMLSKGGAKLLDFGLARFVAPTSAAAPVGPTDTSLTERGAIVGTVQYMAPEQVEGREADARSDIFAFGAVLYEMVTGRKAFEAANDAGLISAILRDQPEPMSVRQPLTPPALDRIVRTCLEKDPDNRWQSAADLARELRWVAAEQQPPASALSSETIVGAAAAAVTRWGAWPLAAGFLLGGVAAGTALWLATRAGQRDAATPVTRTLVRVLPAEQLGGNEGRPTRTGIALSPDGRSLVFSAVRGKQRQIYLRRLVELTANPIAGTDGGNAPFFSHDGQWVGYWAQGELRKVPLDGGVSVTVSKPSDGTPGFGASWGSDDRIVFARGTGGLWQVSANGGTPEQLTLLEPTQGEVSHRLPHVLPGGDAVVFTVTRNRFPRWSETQLFVYSRRTGKRTILIEGGADGRYVATGHLVFAREGVLMAAPFDLTRLRVTGGAVGVVPDLMQAAYHLGSGNDSGAAQFTVSETGALAYVPGGVFPESQNSLVLVDRTGGVQPLPIPPGPFGSPRFSSSGQRLAVHTTGRNRDIWLDEIAQGTFHRLTTEGRSSTPVWTPDGTRIVYMSAIRGPDVLWWRPTDGSGGAEKVGGSGRNLVPASFTRDGQVLAFYELVPDNADIWVLPLNGDRQPRPVLKSSFFEGGADFSPDMRWLAYDSNESRGRQVYVRAYPGPGVVQMISTAGGMSPIWTRDGRELVYMVPSPAGDDEISVMAVPVTTQPVFRVVGTARQLFKGRYASNLPSRGYDVTADGTRFVMVQIGERPVVTVTDIVLVQNWFEEQLKGRQASR